MKRIVFYAAMLFVAFSFVSCKKDAKNQEIQNHIETLSEANQQLENLSENIEKNKNSEPKTSKVKIDLSLQKISKEAFHTDSHAQFLNDPMEFSPIPDQGIKSGETAVVGSDVCRLYPKEAFNFAFAEPDKATLAEAIFDENCGTPIPFSSIVKIIGDKIKNGAEDQNPYANGMFEFQANWNWFYQVEWNGQEGFVFGADLYGLGAKIESNRISAELYRTNGKYDAFYPITGYEPLRKDVKNSLEENRLAIQKTEARERVWDDDMLDEYSIIKGYDDISLFITTDLAAHCQHLIFDRMLQFTEESFFLPRMQNLSEKFIAKLGERSDAPEEIRTKAIKYFQIPELICKTAPQKVETDDWRNPEKYEEKSADEISAILAEYPEDVKSDYDNVMLARGRAGSAIFGYEEDFSQYKPRGHYTKNPLLETYFRAEMWYGRIHFLIAGSESNEMTPVAMLICDTVQKNPDLYKEWSTLFDPITSLIGLSDDLSFYDVLPLWKDEKIDDFASWASDKEKVLAFMKLCQEKLRPPAINGNSVFSGLYDLSNAGSEGLPTNAPMGWRLFGQRFTYDSYIHDQVSPPRLMSRDIVRGLDVMKVFGSRTAELLLADSDYKTMEGLKERLDSLQTAFDSFGNDFWNKTYYNQVLYQVKTLATFEQGAGFYFTESPMWNIKSMLSSHGTWAELRHDTILYVKQSAAERAGDGDFDPTFRTKPLPKPIHYIEPNIPFWQASINAVSSLLKIYSDYDLLDDESESSLTNLLDIYSSILEICEKEAKNKPISESENSWIPTIPSRLNKLIFVHTPNHDIIEDNDQIKMACIADVFSNYGVCLEVGVANPHKIFVPLNDSQGGKRIAVGFCFSYAEFTNPISDRLTDEQWKETVYRSQKNIEDFMPTWEKECLLKAPDDNF